MRNKIKNIIRKILRIQRVRIFLFLIFVPFIYLYLLPNRLFDRGWYAHQRGCQGWRGGRLFGLGHYLLHGRRKGYTPNAFFVPEYFDARNWRNSLLDPLFRYAVQKKNWRQPTSLLFDARKVTHPQKVSPLKYYLKNLKDDTAIPYDDHMFQGIMITWKDVAKSLYESAAQYRQQEDLRNTSSPVYSFDYQKEKAIIEKYSYFKSDSNKISGLPSVSIITPVWNRQDLIIEAIKSVQAQTFTDWELIIVDDGSTDDTTEVVRSCGAADDRIKLVEPGHGGVCKARNAGLAVAHGKWIAFLDSDNTWTPNFLQTMVGSLEDSGHKAAYSAIKMESAERVRYRTTPPNPNLLEVGNYIDLNALVVESSVVKETGYFDERLRRMVDYDLVCRINKVCPFNYVPIIGVRYTDHADVERITNTELVSWDGVVKSKNFIDWDTATDRDDALTSILIPVTGDMRTAMRCAKSVLGSINHGQHVEVIFVDSASTMGTNLSLVSLRKFDARVSYVRVPGSHDNTLGGNYGYSVSRGGRLVFVDQRAIVEKGWLEALIENVPVSDNSIVGGLQLQFNGSVLNAGVLFKGRSASPAYLLEDHPQNDVRLLPDTYRVPSLSSGTLSMSAETFRKLKGFNPLYDKGFEVEDLCLRATRDLEAKIYVAKNSLVTNLNPYKGWNSSSHKVFLADWDGQLIPHKENSWKQAGFDLISYAPKNPNHGKLSQLKAILMTSARESERLKEGKYRWAIKISAPADERRFAWGDMYYAQSIKSELEKLGQTVAIDFHLAHGRTTSYLDDVILDLRGLDDVKPQAGKVNLMWVISHPEKLSKDIVQSFDRVYSAGISWAQYMSQKAGISVGVLPQCTDPQLLHPTPINAEYSDKVLFVGNSRGVLRPIVRDAIEAGLDVAVYGGGWEPLIDKKYIKGKFIPNDKLAEAYSSAKVVLNDHWEDMRKWGFLSNRLFDVAATATPVISDDIAGLDTVFGKLAYSYRTPQDIADIVKAIEEQPIGKVDYDKIAASIRAEHSFEARAKELLRAAEDIVRQQQ